MRDEPCLPPASPHTALLYHTSLTAGAVLGNRKKKKESNNSAAVLEQRGDERTGVFSDCGGFIESWVFSSVCSEDVTLR